MSMDGSMKFLFKYGIKNILINKILDNPTGTNQLKLSRISLTIIKILMMYNENVTFKDWSIIHT